MTDEDFLILGKMNEIHSTYKELFSDDEWEREVNEFEELILKYQEKLKKDSILETALCIAGFLISVNEKPDVFIAFAVELIKRDGGKGGGA